MDEQRKRLSRRMEYTASTMRDCAKEMRKVWDEELAMHAAELEGAAKMLDSWADGIMVPNVK